ncbi:acyl-CoA dehydrogenase family protein [Streptomyces tirandamycinicus]|uniref:Acyl-CoA dehydrogenase n=1 Tax=Streptomyces tirandamycinicus TaxID=2174846 RepID=A0A2S1T2S5_9ACTN|nr:MULTISPECIES: acyl-CoA dehydrogenase family protein [Streptomyces]AWI32817.1 acyl-CoA dehydrogenase [Streptomyces tirandamycinicus]MCY0984726.1 acyl-CoA dehydrogenase family protein [Streptomyces tirandamycinicus]TFE38857.1 acyl-CoA dehydrogenase [Streptomyces sp. ICN441]
MLTADIPTRADLVRRAGELAPLLKRNAAQAEEDRRLQDETIEALAGAGLFRLRVPKRYGGHETDTRTLVEVAAELGRADGAAAWTTSVYWIPTFMACLFPDSVQDEVFSTPDVRICGTLSPSALAAPAEGGIVVNGKWGFVSGARHAHWQEIIAVQPTPDGRHLPVMALVPMSDLQIVDDWDTSGLCGTGSVSTVAQDVFVPQERVIPLPAILQGQYASELNAASPVYRVPLLPVAAASSVGTALGLARAARDAFFERLPGRTLTYTAYETQAEAPLTHHQVAEASLKIDQAEFHAFRLADLVDAKGVAGEEFTLEERARARADMGAVVRLAKEAVDILASASGGSSIYRDVPMQRISRDIQAVSLHALMNPNTNNELYGRVLCGLEPNTLYI